MPEADDDVVWRFLSLDGIPLRRFQLPRMMFSSLLISSYRDSPQRRRCIGLMEEFEYSHYSRTEMNLEKISYVIL